MYNYITDYNSDKYPVGKWFEGSNDTFKILGRLQSNPDKYVLEFSDGKITCVYFSSILRRTVYNKYKPSVFGWGILGEESTKHRSFDTWKGMVRRCYYDNKVFRDRNKSYKDITVCEEWRMFSNYKQWYDNNYIDGYVVDKDILNFKNEVKIYSPETCLFIPEEINRVIVSKNSLYDNKLPLGIYRKGNKYCTSFKDYTTGKRIHLTSKNIEVLQKEYLLGKQSIIEYLLEDSISDKLTTDVKDIILSYYLKQLEEVL